MGNSVAAINQAFQTNIDVDPKHCVLGILDEAVSDPHVKEGSYFRHADLHRCIGKAEKEMEEAMKNLIQFLQIRYV